MRKIYIIYLLFCSILLPVETFSQSKLLLPRVVNYKKSDYYGGSQTWDIKQDSKGILYFANDDGLITFNGTYWKLYPLPNKTIVRSIFIDEQDRIFVGGQGDFGYFYPGAGHALQYVSLKDKIPGPFKSFADIWHIAGNGQSLFFQCTDRIFELSDSTIRVHQAPDFWHYLGQAGQRLFAQDRSNGLLEWKNKRWTPIESRELAKTKTAIAAIVPDGKERFFIATIDNHTYRLQHDSLSKITTASKDDLYTISLDKISDTEYVISTMTVGCLIRNFNNGLVQRISRQEGLQNNKVSCVFVDRDKNVWAAVNNGIDFINYSGAVKYFRLNNDDELGTYSVRVFNKRVYVATTNGVFAAAPSTGAGELSFFNNDFSLLANSDRGEARKLEEVNGRLLLAHNNGVFVINDKTVTPVLSGEGIWTFLPTTSVYPARHILAGSYNGLYSIKYTGNDFKSDGRLAGVTDSYRFLAMDNSGAIWSSHPYRGIYRMQPSADNKSYTTRLFTQHDGLPSTINNYVYKIRNHIVFATIKGVYEFDAVAGRFFPSRLFTPVFNQTPLQYMNEDESGNIWFCSGERTGVVTFSKPGALKPFTLTYFPELTGQAMQRFANIYPYNSENIFVGAERGLIHLNFRKYLTSRPRITVLLSTVKAIGESDSLICGGYFPVNAAGVFAQRAQDIVRLPASFKSFHFEYSAPAFGIQQNIEYSYQLVGYDKQWSAWNARTEKDYTNLPDGSYTFKIKARDNLGHESAIMAYSFIIKAPWYKTAWAILLYLLLAAALVYLLARWQKRKMFLQRQRFEEEKKRLKYVHQLEMEKNEKEIIKLQNEKLVQEILLKEKELANTSMHLAGNTDTLIKIKSEINKLSSAPNREGDVKRIAGLLKDAEKNNANWEQFARHFDELNDGFFKKIKEEYPDLSRSDLKMCAYLRLGLSSKEIAQLVNISVRGVEISRYRLRKKLGLQTEQSLADFLGSISKSV